MNKELKPIFDAYWGIIKVTYPNKVKKYEDGLELFNPEYRDWLILMHDTLINMVDEIESKLKDKGE